MYMYMYIHYCQYKNPLSSDSIHMYNVVESSQLTVVVGSLAATSAWPGLYGRFS